MFEIIQREEQEEKLKSLNETPDYSQYENLNKPRNNYSQYENLNEVKRTPNINENVNDGWANINFDVETKVNGVVQRNNPDPYVQRRSRPVDDPNGLGKFMKENLNEVVRHKPIPPPIVEQPVEKKEEVQIINENFVDSDVITADMWYNMCNASLYPLAEAVRTDIIRKRV